MPIRWRLGSRSGQRRKSGCTMPSSASTVSQLVVDNLKKVMWTSGSSSARRRATPKGGARGASLNSWRSAKKASAATQTVDALASVRGTIYFVASASAQRNGATDEAAGDIYGGSSKKISTTTVRLGFWIICGLFLTTGFRGW